MRYLFMVLLSLTASLSFSQNIQLTDLKKGSIFLVKFQQGQSELDSKSIEDLKVIVEGFEVYKGLRVEVAGHTDFRGNAKANVRLSKDRARIVRDYLVAQEVDKKRISMQAFGGSRPLSKELNQINRRVEILVLENPDLEKNVFGAYQRNSYEYSPEQQAEIPQEIVDTSQVNLKKVALVIGNSKYIKSPKLKNPVNDAELMGVTLNALGFQVSVYNDLDYMGMIQSLKEFSHNLNGSDVVVVYFAGHGMQFNGDNYLLPTDISLENGANDLPLEGINSKTILRILEYTNKESLNILILDACRSSPYNTGTRGSGDGLAELKAPTGTVIAYATSPGSVAYDGEGNNGVYTSQLVKQLNKSQRVEDVFMQTRLNVEAITDGKQSPWELFRLRSIYYFKK